jgi:anti-anti-sigma factor
LQIGKSIQGAVAVLAIKGSMIADDLPMFDEEVQACQQEGILRIVLDLKTTPFIDSAGLERLQDLVSLLGKRGGDLRVACLNDVCRDIFLATRMDGFIQVAASPEEAIRSLQ